MPRVRISISLLISMAACVCAVPTSARADKMTISGTPATTVAVSQSYSFQAEVANANTATLQFKVINLPKWLKAYRLAGVIQGTATTPGVYPNIQVVASDGVHYAFLPPFTITVTAAQAAAATLKITGTPPTTTQVGAYYNFTPTVVATAGVKLSYAIANKPAWAQFSTSTGALTGTPGASNVGKTTNVSIGVASTALSAALPGFTVEVDPKAAAVVTLSWQQPTKNTDGSALTNLAGYVVRYGRSAAALTTSIVIGSASTTSATIENLSSGSWYFAIAARNSENLIGDLSAIVTKTIQ